MAQELKLFENEFRIFAELTPVSSENKDKVNIFLAINLKENINENKNQIEILKLQKNAWNSSEVAILKKLNQLGEPGFLKFYEASNIKYNNMEKFLIRMEPGITTLNELRKFKTSNEECQNEFKIHYSANEAAIILLSLVKKLKILHDNKIFHLDIKPRNIVFHSIKEGFTFIDYGISIDFEKEHTDNPILPGYSPGFLAPEIPVNSIKEGIKVSIDDCAKLDVWSLGISILKIMISAKKQNKSKKADFLKILKTKNDNLLKADGKVQEFYKILEGMLNEDPKARFSVDECYNKLQELRIQESEVSFLKKEASLAQEIHYNYYNFKNHELIKNEALKTRLKGIKLILRSYGLIKKVNAKEDKGKLDSINKCLEHFKKVEIFTLSINLSYKYVKVMLLRARIIYKNYLENEVSIAELKSIFKELNGIQIINTLKKKEKICQNFEYFLMYPETIGMKEKMMELGEETKALLNNEKVKQQKKNKRFQCIKEYLEIIDKKVKLNSDKNALAGFKSLLLVLWLLLGFTYISILIISFFYKSSKYHCNVKKDDCKNGYNFNTGECYCKDGWEGVDCSRRTSEVSCKNNNFTCPSDRVCSNITKVCVRKNDEYLTLEEGKRGIWLPEIVFPENFFACGIRLNGDIKTLIVRDGSGIKAFEFYICNANSNIKMWVYSLIKVNRGNHKWTNPATCKTGDFLGGFRAQIGREIYFDYQGITSINVKCHGEQKWKDLSKKFLIQNKNNYCVWKDEEIILKKNQRVCGFKERIQPLLNKILDEQFISSLSFNFIPKLIELQLMEDISVTLYDDTDLTGLQLKICQA